MIHNDLIGGAQEQLDQALDTWNTQYGCMDKSLAIDGKTMRNAIVETGGQTHTMSAIGHQRGNVIPKKSWRAPCERQRWKEAYQ